MKHNPTKFIVTTTINHPTEALVKYSKMPEWCLIVVGDIRTPESGYLELDCVYLSPEYQNNNYPKLSKAIGWNSIQRRNLGFLEAWKRGAEIIATVDDDNIPYKEWGQNLLVNKIVEIDLYHTDLPVFDPLSVTNNKYLWHRGFPIELVSKKNNGLQYLGKQSRRCLVQADLWDGDPDIDAIARLSIRPIVKFENIDPYSSDRISPFNSQNTFLAREVVPFYAVFPHIGRMDDIWGSYALQRHFPDSVVYNKATVYQNRNEQDIITNLEKEILGYRETLNFINKVDDWLQLLPEETRYFWGLYQECFC